MKNVFILIIIYAALLLPCKQVSANNQGGSEIVMVTDLDHDVGMLVADLKLPVPYLNVVAIPTTAPVLAHGHPRHHWKDSKWRPCEAVYVRSCETPRISRPRLVHRIELPTA